MPHSSDEVQEHKARDLSTTGELLTADAATCDLMAGITACLQQTVCEPLGLLGHALIGAWPVQDLQGLDASHHGQRVPGQCTRLHPKTHSCRLSRQPGRSDFSSTYIRACLEPWCQ